MLMPPGTWGPVELAELPALLVGSGGRLRRDVEAFFDDRSLDCTLQVQPLADRSRGGQDVVSAVIEMRRLIMAVR